LAHRELTGLHLFSSSFQVFKGIFGSKEAADEFLATDQGKEFASKLASIESRDLDSDSELESPEKRLSWGKAAAGAAAAVVGCECGFDDTKPHSFRSLVLVRFCS